MVVHCFHLKLVPSKRLNSVVYLPRSHCTLTRLLQNSASFCQLKATFHYAIQLPTSSLAGRRPTNDQIPLRYPARSSLADRRPADEPARDQLASICFD